MTKTVKFLFRKAIFPLVYHLKLQHLFNTNGNKRLVVNYHGVIENRNLKYNGRHFSKSVFEKHLLYYKKNFHVVTLADIFSMYRENIVPSKKTIAITFDDGFENNFNVAFPLLKKYNLPATFFVSGVCVENNNPILWPEIVNILGYFEKKIVVRSQVFVKDKDYNLINLDKNLTLYDFIKQHTAKDRDIIIEDILNKYNLNHALNQVEPDIWKLLKVEQIKELAESGLIEIASHGYLHYNLANLTEEEAYNDLKRSKDVLENLIRTKIESIAFPDSSYNDKVKSICLSLGYQNMCAVTYQNVGDDKDKNLLPRHGLSATTNYYSNIVFLHKAFNKSGF